MDSKPRVSLSTTPEHALSNSLSPSGSLPIRAPPTLSDSDSDSNFEIPIRPNSQELQRSTSSNSSYTSYSDSGFTEGFASGEEGFETASERPFVGDPDEEFLGESVGVDEYVVSRPFVGDPDEESIETAIEEYGDSVGDDDDERVSVVGHVVAYNTDLKRGMPIAQLSGDDDGDNDVSEVENEGFLGVVRVPGIGVVEKIDGVSKVMALGVGDGEERECLMWRGSSFVVEQSETLLAAKRVGGSGSGEFVDAGNGVLGHHGEESSVVEESVKDSDFGVAEVANIDTLLASEIYIMGEISKLEEEETNEVVKGSAAMVSASGIVSSVVVKPVNPKFVEAEKDVNLIYEGNLIADKTQHAVLISLEENVAWGTDKKRKSEIGRVEVSEGAGLLGMVYNLKRSVTEECGDVKLLGEDIGDDAELKEQSFLKDNGSNESLEPILNLSRGSKELNLQELKADVPEAKENVCYEPEVPEDSQSSQKIGSDVSVILEQCSDNAKSDSEVEPETSFGAVPHDPVAANIVEDINNANEIQAADPTKISETNPAQKTKYWGNGDFPGTAEADGLYNKCNALDSTGPSSNLDFELKLHKQDEANSNLDEGEEDDAESLIFGNSVTAMQIMNELEQRSAPESFLHAESSQDHDQRIDGQIFTDSDEEAEIDEEGEGMESLDSAALTAFLRAATSAGSDGSSVTITSGDGSRVYSLEHPVGLGSSLRSLRPAPSMNQSSFLTPPDLTAGIESDDNLSDEEKKKMEKIQLIRVKFLRLVQRLGHSPEASIAAQVFHRLNLAAGRHSSQAFSLESAKRMAMQLEAEGKDDLDFSINILVLGKTGVGKSATINSIFGEEKSMIDAFEPATKAIKEIVGTIDGVKMRVFDTPGLRSSVMEQTFNQRTLLSIKSVMKKCPPDVVLYVDRLDNQTRDLNDLPLLRSITSSLGSSIWQNTIVTLTHAASAPPDGPSGSPLSYHMFVAQQSHVFQQSISQAVGDLCIMNPVSLVENHPFSGKNRHGQMVLPDGQFWKLRLLLLCYSIKILSQVNSISKPQDPFDHRKLFGFRVHSPPLPYLLSSLLHPKLSADQGGENVDLGDISDSDKEDEDEYDQLPPFKPLRKSQMAKLSREQKKAYFEEYEYRVKLLEKKQWREEVKRLREVKKRGNDYGQMGEDENPESVAVPLPDMVLPPSFDGDDPAYRYRFLEPTSQLLTRPVLDMHGWDHDCGYNGVSLEENLAIAGKFPAVIAVQVTKDKSVFNIHLDSSISAKHGENGSTMVGFDIQSMGKQLAYILRGETKMKNLKMNKTAAGVSITFLGENVTTGLKVEDQVSVGKRLVLGGSAGVVRSQSDAAYGANFEVCLKEKDFPTGEDQCSLGLSLMKWRGDLALTANLHSQFSIGRGFKMAVRAGLNNRKIGQITVRTSGSEQVQIALMGIVPIAIAIFRSIWSGFSRS